MKPRLYLPAGSFQPNDEAIALTTEQSHYVLQVLRLKTGDTVQIFDGQGQRYDAIVSSAGKRTTSVGQLHPVASDSKPTSRLQVTLVQGLARSDRMDWVIEKATELGVSRIIPWLAERSTVRLDAQRGQKRREHWTRVSEAACMQCGRDVLPQIDAPQTLADLLKSLQNLPGPLLTLTPDAVESLSEWAGAQRTDSAPIAVSIVIGPESGFSTDEESALKAAGAQPVSIGPRILRTETAGVAALTVLHAICGDLA